MKDPITTENLKEVYGRVQTYYQDGSLESIRNEKQYLEGLILSFREVLRKKLTGFIKNNDIVINKVTEIEYMTLIFDEHFGIITQKQGKI